MNHPPRRYIQFWKSKITLHFASDRKFYIHIDPLNDLQTAVFLQKIKPERNLIVVDFLVYCVFLAVSRTLLHGTYG